MSRISGDHVAQLKYKARSINLELYRSPSIKAADKTGGWMIEDVKRGVVISGERESIDLEMAEIIIDAFCRKFVSEQKTVNAQSEEARIRQLKRRAMRMNLKLYRNLNENSNCYGEKPWILAKLDTGEIVAGAKEFLDLESAAAMMNRVGKNPRKLPIVNKTIDVAEESRDKTAEEENLVLKAERLNLRLYKLAADSTNQQLESEWVLEDLNSLQVIAGKERILTLDKAARILNFIEEKCEARYSFDVRLCKCRECYLKRIANDNGYILIKSQGGTWKVMDQGGYRLYDKSKIVLGNSFEATLDEVENFLFKKIEENISEH